MPSWKALRARLHRSFVRDGRLLFLLAFFAILLAIAIALLSSSKFLRTLASEMALSDATDKVTVVVNDKINERMDEGKYDYDYFVTLQRDDSGAVTAISANMTRINSLASEILREIITSSAGGALNISIPVGNLTGSNLLLGRGPKIPVKVLMLTSSYADFRNDISSAGINQIRHQIILELTVEIDVLMPWEIKSTEVKSEVLIAETVIVGSVPGTYLSLNKP